MLKNIIYLWLVLLGKRAFLVVLQKASIFSPNPGVDSLGLGSKREVLGRRNLMAFQKHWLLDRTMIIYQV